MVTAERVIDRLLASEEPAIRFKTRVHVLKESVGNRRIRALQEEIRRSSRVRRLLSGRDASGRLRGRGVYDKWRGAHWVLATLADIGYPRGDKSLQPMRDQLMERWLNRESFYEEFDADTRAGSYGRRGVPVIQGRSPALRVAAEQRPLQRAHAGARGLARGASGRTVAALAVARRRLELRSQPRSPALVVHGIDPALARPLALRCARRATSRRDARPNARPKFFSAESSSAVGPTTR